MVGNNNPFTTENTRKQGKTTVGEEMMGGWQVTPTIWLSFFSSDLCIIGIIVSYPGILFAW